MLSPISTVYTCSYLCLKYTSSSPPPFYVLLCPMALESSFTAFIVIIIIWFTISSMLLSVKYVEWMVISKMKAPQKYLLHMMLDQLNFKKVNRHVDVALPNLSCLPSFALLPLPWYGTQQTFPFDFVPTHIPPRASFFWFTSACT